MFVRDKFTDDAILRLDRILKNHTFDNRNLREIANSLIVMAMNGEGAKVITLNLQILRMGVQTNELHEIINRSHIWLADGWPIQALIKLYGSESRRNTGVDLVKALLLEMNKFPVKIGYIGGDEELESIIQKDGQNKNNALVSLSAKEFSLPISEQDISLLRNKLDDKGVQIVLVCLGTPKQDYIIDALQASNEEIVFIPCGASLDFIFGIKKRAPSLFQRNRLEWLWRLASEPKRLGKRYASDFAFLVRVYPIVKRLQVPKK